MQGGGSAESIFGGRFADETFRLKHDRPGVLSMANSGPNTNGSGFFITCVTAPENDGRHVAFGAVTSGMDVVRVVEAVGTGNGTPSQAVTIIDCGELKARPCPRARLT